MSAFNWVIWAQTHRYIYTDTNTYRQADRQIHAAFNWVLWAQTHRYIYTDTNTYRQACRQIHALIHRKRLFHKHRDIIIFRPSFYCQLQLSTSAFTFSRSFISAMYHCECVAPNVDINLQGGRFWAMSAALFRERLNDSRSCWIVFIHVVQGRPDGVLQFSRGKLLRSSLHLFRLAVVQCGRTGRDAVLGQWPRWFVAHSHDMNHPGCFDLKNTARLLWTNWQKWTRERSAFDVNSSHTLSPLSISSLSHAFTCVACSRNIASCSSSSSVHLLMKSSSWR